MIYSEVRTMKFDSLNNHNIMEIDMPKSMIDKNVNVSVNLIKIEGEKESKPYWTGVCANIKNNKIIIDGICDFRKTEKHGVSSKVGGLLTFEYILTEI